MKSFIYYFFIAFALLLFVSFWGFYWAIFPIKIQSHVTPQMLNLPFENVVIKTQDHLQLHGWFIPAKKINAKTIILLHGYPADKGDILPAMQFLHDNFNLLLFDFRYFGTSEGFYSTAGKKEVLDLLGAIDYLHTRGINEVGVWGFSMGGAVAIMAANKTPAIKAIIADSSYARLDWMAEEYYRIPILRYPLAWLTRFWAWVFLQLDLKEISPGRDIKELKIPILLIHSDSDTVVPYRHAEYFSQAIKNNPNVKQIILQHTPHGALSDSVKLQVANFFAKNLN